MFYLTSYKHGGVSSLNVSLELSGMEDKGKAVFTPSPGSPAWFEEKDKFVGNPFSLHDCMHPLIQTKMPLRKFYRHFSSLVSEGGNKNPLRSTGNRLPPLDIVRVLYASYTYSRCLRKAYRDYPKELW